MNIVGGFPHGQLTSESLKSRKRSYFVMNLLQKVSKQTNCTCADLSTSESLLNSPRGNHLDNIHTCKFCNILHTLFLHAGYI